MPAEFLGEVLLRFVFEIVLYTVCYTTGAVLVPVVTFGAYRAEFMSRPVKGKRRVKGAGPHLPRTLSADGTMLLGLAFWVAVAVGSYWVLARNGA